MSSLAPVNQQTLSMAARLLVDLLPDLKLANSAFVMAARTMAITLVRQSLIFFIFSWLILALAPATLPASFRHTTANLVVDTMDRNFPSHSQYYYQVVNSTKSAYEWSGLDNTVCKKYIACRAGEYVVTDYSRLASWLKTSSWLDTLSYYANLTEDSYVKLTVAAMDPEKQETCHQSFEPCESWLKIEKLLGITQPTPKVQDEVTTVTPLPANQPVQSVIRGGLFNLFTARPQ